MSARCVIGARLRRDQAGFTLVELMLVSTLFIVILLPTLAVLDGSGRHVRQAEARSDQVELARNSLDRMARQLRNLAQRLDHPTIRKAAGDDLIFQTADPTRTWVRYCLDTGTAPASASNGRIWEMVSASAQLPSSSGACPGSGAGWESEVVTERVTNALSDLPVFRYTCQPGVACAASSEWPTGITGVSATLAVDDDPASGPPATRMSTAVYLRNQNEPPTASFSATPAGRTRQVVLNGSASNDPEGRTLRFYWFPGEGAPEFSCRQGPPDGSGAGTGVTLTHTFPTTVAVGSIQPVTLVVCDPGDLQARFTANVQVPA